MKSGSKRFNERQITGVDDKLFKILKKVYYKKKLKKTKMDASISSRPEIYSIAIQKLPHMHWILCPMRNQTICIPADILSMKSWHVPMTNVSKNTKTF